MDRSARSSAQLKNRGALDDRTAEERARLRADLPGGWAYDVAVEVAHDMVAPLAEHARLRPVLLRLLGNLSEEPSLEAAAKVVNLAPKYFSKFFSDETGFRFCSWHSDVRIRIAAHLLHESDGSIGSIGHAVGYANPTTFARAFRKCLGIAASEYRRLQNRRANAGARATAREARARKRSVR